MANNPLEKKLECESRLMRLIMQDTHPSPPSPPTCKVVFVHLTLAVWLVSLTKTTLNTGKGGHIIVHSSCFSSGLGDMMVPSRYTYIRCRCSSYGYIKYAGLYTCYTVLPAPTAYNCLRQPYSLSSRSSTVRRTCRTRPELVPELVGWIVQLAALVK